MQPLSISDAVRNRRSVRAFLDKPVPLNFLQEVLDTARMSPSGCNFQPWEATVLTGAALRSLQEKLLQSTHQDPVEYDIVPAGIGQEYMARQQALGALMYNSLEIEREDTDARTAFSQQNILSFGAPVLLLCHVPRVMGPPQWSDVGMWLQTVMLLLREKGLDSCPQEYMSLYGRLIKEYIDIPDATHILFCGLAIGYRDEAAPINHFERPRLPLDEQVRFIGF